MVPDLPDGVPALSGIRLRAGIGKEISVRNANTRTETQVPEGGNDKISF